MHYDVVALGELLIDFTQHGRSAQGNDLFEANPGGAPCNVLSMLQRLGRNTAFIGKVGDDAFGHMLTDAVAEQGIHIGGLRFDPQVHTTLALVHTKPDGDRNFSFYRSPGADMMLRADEIDNELLENASVFHFGSLSMTDDIVFEATRHAIAAAERHGALRSFDPNLREPLWSSLSLARERIRYGLAHCDVLKISDNEIVWLTDETDYTHGVEAIRSEFDIPLILVSMGSEGSRAYGRFGMIEVHAFRTDQTVETTGAGDTFCACMLHAVLAHGLDEQNPQIWNNDLRFANAAASIVTTRHGALLVMPEREEVDALIKQYEEGHV